MARRDPLAFYKKYTLVNSTRELKQSSSDVRRCRYCNKVESSTTFNIKAHIIPELLGENDFLALDECDACNQKFSAYESHLSKFFMPYLTMNGVKGKTGIPQFHSRSVNGNEDTRTIIKASDNKREILLADLNDYIIDEESKTMTVVFRKPPHKPLWVFKALAKIGISLIPANLLKEHQNVIEWLLYKNAEMFYFPHLTTSILTYQKMVRPFADLYKANRMLFSRSFIPEYTMIFGFGNVIGQIFLPPSLNEIYERARNKKPVLEMFPGFSLDGLTQKDSGMMYILGLVGNKTITYDQRLSFKFQEAKVNIQN